MNLDTFILIIVPVVAWLLIKRFLRSLLVSWLIGVPFLWLNMARHETRAPVFESPLIFVLAMGYWATLLIAFYAMVVTTAWALRCIWRDEGGWEEGGRCDSTRQCERLPPAATPGSGTVTRYSSLRTSEQVALFGSVIVCLYLAVAVAVEFGGLLGGLAMVGMYSVGVLVADVRMDASRAWAVAALTPSVVPFVLLAVALIIDAFLPFELRTSQPWQDVVDAFYVASLMASGLLGILVTLAVEENFPRDGDWIYGTLLAGAAAVQWFTVFCIGQGLLCRARNSRTRLVFCFVASLSVYTLAFWLHLALLITKK